jgi:hypothetical protein
MDYQPEACTTAGGRYFLRDPTWIIGGTSTEQNRTYKKLSLEVWNLPHFNTDP